MIISGAELLRRVAQAFPTTTTFLAFPFLRARIVSADFEGLTDDEREALVAERIQLEVPSLRKLSDRLFLRFERLAHDSEEKKIERRGESWLGAFADDERRFDPGKNQPKVAHFYGYKGGQGRSTLLAFLAMSMAFDGHRVLIVDIDAEAPSLDLLMGVSHIPPEASLVGLRAGLDVIPLPVVAPRGGGAISLVAFGLRLRSTISMPPPLPSKRASRPQRISGSRLNSETKLLHVSTSCCLTTVRALARRCPPGSEPCQAP